MKNEPFVVEYFRNDKIITANFNAYRSDVREGMLSFYDTEDEVIFSCLIHLVSCAYTPGKVIFS